MISNYWRGMKATKSRLSIDEQLLLSLQGRNQRRLVFPQDGKLNMVTNMCIWHFTLTHQVKKNTMK